MVPVAVQLGGIAAGHVATCPMYDPFSGSCAKVTARPAGYGCPFVSTSWKVMKLVSWNPENRTPSTLKNCLDCWAAIMIWPRMGIVTVTLPVRASAASVAVTTAVPPVAEDVTLTVATPLASVTALAALRRFAGTPAMAKATVRPWTGEPSAWTVAVMVDVATPSAGMLALDAATAIV